MALCGSGVCSVPWLAEAAPVSATTVVVSATPPSLGGPWVSFAFTIKPTVAGAGKAVTATCTSPMCNVYGLKESTTYTVSVLAKATSGAAVSAPNALEVTTLSAR